VHGLSSGFAAPYLLSRKGANDHGTSHMILDRLYNPPESELIYHYCPPLAFLEIIRSRTMWHSAYYTLNDLSERRWAYSQFDKAVNQIQGEVVKTFTDAVRVAVNMALSTSLVMISSYSLDPDVLSQWRAYADDGCGFAIGFNAKQMQMPAKALRVLYDEDAQLQELVGNLKHTHDYEKSIGFKFDDNFRSHLFNIGLDLCAYKHPAFREEKEIRRAHVSGLVPQEKSIKIVALGALDQDGNRLSEPMEIHFRTSRGILIPYVALDYSNRGQQSPVKEIILGPKNKNAELNIEIFLNTVGMKDVTLRRSAVPYA
jgi:hypothetical protein